MLIGANMPKAMEPWEVLSNVGSGLYTVRTKLWTINDPWRETLGQANKKKIPKTMETAYQ